MNRKVDTTPPGRAVVIGAGIAGLGAAIRLAVKGYDTHVVEARKEPGGKLHSFDLEGFRFDAGPSLFTMPEQVTELFDLAGRDPAAASHRRLAYAYMAYLASCAPHRSTARVPIRPK